MGIAQICQTISNYFSNIRPPFPQLSRILLVCSMIKRPGLSTLQSVANITKDLNKLGIPTGSMPDGSTNLTVAFAFASTKEIYRGIKKDMSIQVGIMPGTLASFGVGANAGGPVTIISNNTTPAMGYGKAN
jgi:hypothetical protein